MEDGVLLALLSKAVEKKLEELPRPSRASRGNRGVSGAEGPQGPAGKDFVFEEHEEQIKGWIKDFTLKFSDLAAEEIEQLRGPRGHEGLAGRSFFFDEHAEKITDLVRDHVSEIAPGLKLQFSDLSSEEVEQLRGPRGSDGNNGRSFIFTEHEERITGLIKSHLKDLSPELKLRFSDLLPEEIEQLRGPRGHDGEDFIFEKHKVSIEEIVGSEFEKNLSNLKLKFSDLDEHDVALLKGPRGPEGRRGCDGKDFNFEEHRGFFESLKAKFSDFTEAEIEELRGPRGRDGKDGRAGKDFDFEEYKDFFESLRMRFADLSADEIDELKLKFSHLSAEEKDSLKLKFADLTDADKIDLRGPRGQRGSKGVAGPKGETGRTGDMGPQGLPGPVGVRGLPGTNGINGDNGQDGQDAPRVVDVEVVQNSEKNFSLRFIFNDGSVVETDKIDLPKLIKEVWVLGGGIGKRGGGGGTSTLEFFDENGDTLGIPTEVEFTGSGVTSTTDGTRVTVEITGGGTPGADGKSAYEIALDNGFVGTEADWLASLVGDQGPQGDPGADGAPGATGATGAAGTNGTNGTNGTDGADGATGATGAAGTNGTNGTNGTDGADGESAYQIALDNGFVGTEAEWLASLVGPQGDVGPTGPPGTGGDGEVEHTTDLADNQSSPVDIAGMTLGVEKSYYIHYYIERTWDTSLMSDWSDLTGVETIGSESIIHETGLLLATRTGSTCRVTDVFSDADAGVVFSIDAAGQVQYESTNLGGGNTFKITWKFSRLSDASDNADIINDSASPVDVDGMVVPLKSNMIHYFIERVTTGAGATELYESGILFATKMGSGFRLTYLAQDGDAGVVLSVGTGGQIEQVTTDITGTPDTSKISWQFFNLVG